MGNYLRVVKPSPKVKFLRARFAPDRFAPESYSRSLSRIERRTEQRRDTCRGSHAMVARQSILLPRAFSDFFLDPKHQNLNSNFQMRRNRIEASITREIDIVSSSANANALRMMKLALCLFSLQYAATWCVARPPSTTKSMVRSTSPAMITDAEYRASLAAKAAAQRKEAAALKDAMMEAMVGTTLAEPISSVPQKSAKTAAAAASTSARTSSAWSPSRAFEQIMAPIYVPDAILKNRPELAKAPAPAKAPPPKAPPAKAPPAKAPPANAAAPAFNLFGVKTGTAPPAKASPAKAPPSKAAAPAFNLFGVKTGTFKEPKTFAERQTKGTLGERKVKAATKTAQRAAKNGAKEVKAAKPGLFAGLFGK